MTTYHTPSATVSYKDALRATIQNEIEQQALLLADIEALLEDVLEGRALDERVKRMLIRTRVRLGEVRR